MKGPGLRIDLDVRRIWRCAKCGKMLRTAGHVTAQRCTCADGASWMTLQLPPAKRQFTPPVREPLPDPDNQPEDVVVCEADPAPGQAESAAQSAVAAASGSPAVPVASDGADSSVAPAGDSGAEPFGAGLPENPTP